MKKKKMINWTMSQLMMNNILTYSKITKPSLINTISNQEISIRDVSKKQSKMNPLTVTSYLTIMLINKQKRKPRRSQRNNNNQNQCNYRKRIWKQLKSKNKTYKNCRKYRHKLKNNNKYGVLQLIFANKCKRVSAQ